MSWLNATVCPAWCAASSLSHPEGEPWWALVALGPPALNPCRPNLKASRWLIRWLGVTDEPNYLTTDAVNVPLSTSNVAYAVGCLIKRLCIQASTHRVLFWVNRGVSEPHKDCFVGVGLPNLLGAHPHCALCPRYLLSQLRCETLDAHQPPWRLRWSARNISAIILQETLPFTRGTNHLLELHDKSPAAVLQQDKASRRTWHKLIRNPFYTSSDVCPMAWTGCDVDMKGGIRSVYLEQSLWGFYGSVTLTFMPRFCCFFSDVNIVPQPWSVVQFICPCGFYRPVLTFCTDALHHCDWHAVGAPSAVGMLWIMIFQQILVVVELCLCPKFHKFLIHKSSPKEENL